MTTCVFQAHEHSNYEEVWKAEEAQLMRGHIALMVLQDKLGSKHALRLFEQDIEKYQPGTHVTEVS